MLLADAVAVHDDELAVGGTGEASRGRELLRRDRDALEFTAINGTFGAQAPCFSPDSKRVAFFHY